MARAEESTKLIDLLKSRLAEGETEKLVRQVTQKVGQAKIVASQELFNLELSADQAKESLETLTNSVGASLTQIVEAGRLATLATKNLEDAKAIFEARF